MPESPGDMLKRFFVSAMRRVLYVVLLAVRVLARLLLLAATVIPVTIPFVAIAMLIWWSEEIVNWTAQFLEGGYLLPKVMAYLVAAGLLLKFLEFIIKVFWEAVKKLFAPVQEIVRDGWKPYKADDPHDLGARTLASLGVTWRENIAKIPGNLALTAWRAALATATAVAATFLVAAAIPFLSDKPQFVDRYVWVGDAAGEATQSEIEDYLRADTVFSLIHLKDAQLRNGESGEDGGGGGICLDESQRLWLDQFRKAVAKCVTLARADGQDSEVPLLEVTAFASIAPVRSEDVSSAKLNCEIANRRADAVGAYLAHGGIDAPNDEHKRKWECPSVKCDFEKAQKHCAPSGENGDYSYVQAGSQEPIFKVRVHQWQDPSTMQGGKPADDGTVPDRRRYDVELFNRSVHISAPRGFCRPRKSEQSEGSSTADGTTNVQPQGEDTNALE